jgi:spore cortex formation protein SpoVR/YcgB (stage V sporulation)
MAHVYGHCDFFKNNFWFSQLSAMTKWLTMPLKSENTSTRV